MHLQLTRQPLPLATWQIKPRASIFDDQFDDFSLSNDHAHAHIKAAAV